MLYMHRINDLSLNFIPLQAKYSDTVAFVMTRSSAGPVVIVLWDQEGGHASENIASNMALVVQQGL